jgi:hypothetical protein
MIQTDSEQDEIKRIFGMKIGLVIFFEGEVLIGFRMLFFAKKYKRMRNFWNL